MDRSDIGFGSIAPLHDVHLSPWIRRIAWLLLLVFVVGIVFVLLAPWRQNVLGNGRVIAYSPMDRPQVVTAPIKGVVEEVYVLENQRVEKGEKLLKILDQDPLKLERLREKVLQAQVDLESSLQQVETYAHNITILEEARDFVVTAFEAKVESARNKVESAEQKLAGAEAALIGAQAIARSMEELAPKYAPYLKLVEARQKLAQAEAAVASERAAIQSARADYDNARAEVEKERRAAEAKINEERTKLQAAQSKVAMARQKKLDAESAQAAQERRDVRAPRAGRVFKLSAVPGSTVIEKGGQPLLEIVPDSAQKAVELFVRGNDAPLIQAGRQVRLQFEGWPAVQIVAWPSVAVGTFGGVVSLIDATDSGPGRFRLLIVPDPEDDPWPDDRWLRQGTRAQGWVLLNEVPVWFELWRQLNGFPPAVAKSEAEAAEGGK